MGKIVEKRKTVRFLLAPNPKEVSCNIRSDC